MATEATEGVPSVVDVSPVDETFLRAALALGWRDFEDVWTPAETVAWIEAARQQQTILLPGRLHSARVAAE